MPPKKKTDEPLSYESFIKQQVALLCRATENKDTPIANTAACKVLDAARSQAVKKALPSAVIKQIAGQLSMLDTELASKRRKYTAAAENEGTVTIDMQAQGWLRDLPSNWPVGSDDENDPRVQEYSQTLQKVQKLEKNRDTLQQQRDHYRRLAEALQSLTLESVNTQLPTVASELGLEMQRTKSVIDAAQEQS